MTYNWFRRLFYRHYAKYGPCICRYYLLYRNMSKICSVKMILIDNTIWKGKVMDDNDKTNSTKSIRELVIPSYIVKRQ